MTKGIGPIEPWPMNLNSGGRVKSPSGRPPVRSRQTPRAITMKASETMKWCRPMRVTQSPIASPMPALAAIASAEATQGSTPARNSQPAKTIAKATTEPTERSMPPEIRRMVMPTTTMPSTAKAMRHRPHVLPGQEVGRGEAHHREEQQDHQDQPGLALADEPPERAAAAHAGLADRFAGRGHWQRLRLRVRGAAR